MPLGQRAEDDRVVRVGVLRQLVLDGEQWRSVSDGRAGTPRCRRRRGSRFACSARPARDRVERPAADMRGRRRAGRSSENVESDSARAELPRRARDEVRAPSRSWSGHDEVAGHAPTFHVMGESVPHGRRDRPPPRPGRAWGAYEGASTRSIPIETRILALSRTVRGVAQLDVSDGDAAAATQQARLGDAVLAACRGEIGDAHLVRLAEDSPRG